MPVVLGFLPLHSLYETSKALDEKKMSINISPEHVISRNVICAKCIQSSFFHRGLSSAL